MKKGEHVMANLEQKVSEILANENLTKEEKNNEIIALVREQNRITEFLLEREEEAAGEGIRARNKKDREYADNQRKFAWS